MEHNASNNLVNVNGKELFVTLYQPFKNQPTLVFLHDSLGCITLWRDFPMKLGELTNCNVMVYDREGYGKSQPFSNPERDNFYLEREADVLNGLLEELNIDNALLFGHSDGGSIALLTASNYPSKIKGVITEGAHVFVEEVTLKGINEAIEAYHNTDLVTRLKKYHGENTEEMFWAWAKTWNTEAFRSWNIERFLPSIKCPCLIMQGEDDEFGTLHQVNSIVNQVSGPSEKLILPKVQHTPHKEAPDLVLKACQEFIAKIG